MAVTQHTNNFLTLIQENGSAATGTGGNIINANFERLDEQFTSASSSWAAKRAVNASYADYAYSCAGGNSSSTIAEFAQRAGFATPEYDDTYNNKPIAVWGSYGAVYTSDPCSSGSPQLSGMCQSAGLPPFGPFLCKVLVCAYKSFDRNSRVFAECLVGGWNLAIDTVKILNAFNNTGTTVTVTPVTSGTYPATQDGICLYFAVENNQLECGCTFDRNTGGYTHVSVFSLYPSSSELACS